VSQPAFLLIDDHALFRTGLRMLLADAAPEAQLVEVDSTEALMAAPPAITPELILLDVTLPGIHGLAGLAWLRQHFGAVPVLMLSARDDETVVSEALRLGANGFVSKSAPPQALLQALKDARRGQDVWPLPPQPTVLTARDASGEATGWRPTALQQRILQALALYKSNKALSKALELPEHIVRAELSMLMERMGVLSRADALAAARQQGWVTDAEAVGVPAVS
jgi:DNA-binding NarL/FixJ family response regulator